jgi:hypothetical protein
MPLGLHVGMSDVNYPFVSCFQKALCEDCGPSNYGWVEEGSGNMLSSIGTRIPSFFLWHHDTSLNSFGGGIGVVWSSPLALDVPYWKVFGNLKMICVEWGKIGRKHG